MNPVNTVDISNPPRQNKITMAKRLSDLPLFHLENLQLILSLCADDVKAMETFKEISRSLAVDIELKTKELNQVPTRTGYSGYDKCDC